MGDIGRSFQAGATLGAAAIDAAAQTGITAMNNATQKDIAADYNQSQWDLAHYQNDYNQQMWNMQNEYNSPAAQMQRLEDAGLNPNLIYGSGSAVGNSSSAPEAAATPNLQMPQYQGYTFGNVFSRAVSAFYDNKLKQENVELAKTQQEFVEAQAEGQRIKNMMDAAYTPFSKQLAERQIDVLESQYREQRSREASSFYDAEAKQYRWFHVVPLEERQALTDLALKEADLKVSSERYKLIQSQTAKIMFEIEHLLPLQMQLDAKKQEYMTQQIGLALARNKMITQDANFWERFGISKDQSNVIMSAVGAIIRAGQMLE